MVELLTGNLRVNFEAGNAVVRSLLDALQEVPTVVEVIEEDANINTSLKKTS